MLLFEAKEVPPDLLEFFEPVHADAQNNVFLLGPEPCKLAHFATFPTEIPRRAIKAGTSKKGCCPECGAGWVREVKRSGVNASNEPGIADMIAKGVPRQKANLYVTQERGQITTTGWRPGCECGHDPIPCVVLDPFCGSGTTGAVCQELGREFVGLDLSWDYLQLARERTGAKALDEWQNGIQTDSMDVTDLPLWNCDINRRT